MGEKKDNFDNFDYRRIDICNFREQKELGYDQIFKELCEQCVTSEVPPSFLSAQGAFTDLSQRTEVMFETVKEHLKELNGAIESLEGWAKAGEIQSREVNRLRWAEYFSNIEIYLDDLRARLSHLVRPIHNWYWYCSTYAREFAAFSTLLHRDVSDALTQTQHSIEVRSSSFETNGVDMSTQTESIIEEAYSNELGNHDRMGIDDDDDNDVIIIEEESIENFEQLSRSSPSRSIDDNANADDDVADNDRMITDDVDDKSKNEEVIIIDSSDIEEEEEEKIQSPPPTPTPAPAATSTNRNDTSSGASTHFQRIPLTESPTYLDRAKQESFSCRKLESSRDGQPRFEMRYKTHGDEIVTFEAETVVADSSIAKIPFHHIQRLLPPCICLCLQFNSQDFRDGGWKMVHIDLRTKCNLIHERMLSFKSLASASKREPSLIDIDEKRSVHSFQNTSVRVRGVGSGADRNAVVFCLTMEIVREAVDSWFDYNRIIIGSRTASEIIHSLRFEPPSTPASSSSSSSTSTKRKRDGSSSSSSSSSSTKRKRDGQLCLVESSSQRMWITNFQNKRK